RTYPLSLHDALPISSLEALSHFAVTYNINLIAGSLPVLEGDTLYNNAYLCRRDGTVDRQPKIHITPHERRDWVIQGGNTLQAFRSEEHTSELQSREK